jgi:hypothetical protein
MAKSPTTGPHVEFELASKYDLHHLANRMLTTEPAAIDLAIKFVLAGTRGHWHGRGRAMMCRRLKHCELGQADRALLVGTIIDRLATGTFSEQFKDQLRLALHLDFRRTVEACREIAGHPRRPYVGRYAQWVLSPERKPAG